MKYPTPAAIGADARDSVENAPRPRWWVYTALAAVIWLYLWTASAMDTDLILSANVIGPVVMALLGIAEIMRLIRLSKELIWTPYFWFVFVVVAFYGAGPLVYPLGGVVVRNYLNSFIPMNPSKLLWTNCLDAVGILFVFLGVSITAQRRKTVIPINIKANKMNLAPAHVAVLFLASGALLEYGLILPSDFGIYHLSLPGVLRSLNYLYLLGLMVMAFVVTKGRKGWLVPFLLLWVIQLIVAFLVFRKHALIFTLLLPVLGSYLADGKISKLFVGGLLGLVLYLSVAQLFLWGRGQIYQATGNLNYATLSTRIDIVGRWFDEGMPNGPGGGQINSSEAGWARLSFASEQAFAMQRYDSGYPGNTLRNAAIVLVPRLIWPQKPVTTSLAVQFYSLVTGKTDTHLGLSIFGEGYWDYGWIGVSILSFLAGIVFGVTSRYSLDWINKRNFLYLPSVAIGITMGLGGTRHFFVNGIIGPTAIFLAYALVVGFIVKMLPRRGTSMVTV